MYFLPVLSAPLLSPLSLSLSLSPSFTLSLSFSSSVSLSVSLYLSRISPYFTLTGQQAGHWVYPVRQLSTTRRHRGLENLAKVSSGRGVEGQQALWETVYPELGREESREKLDFSGQQQGPIVILKN